jgi:predicted methyltransferase
MDYERMMLEDLQFDVQIHSPHRFALSTLKMSQG